VTCSHSVDTVPDLRRNNVAVAGGRSRTNTNETEIEAARACVQTTFRRVAPIPRTDDGSRAPMRTRCPKSG